MLLMNPRGEDGRQRPIALTAAGRTFFDQLDGHVHDHVSSNLAHLDGAGRVKLIEALATVEQLLSHD